MPVPLVRATRDSIRYGHAVGKVRVLETKVFGRATYERLLDAADSSEQLRILSDTLYGRFLDGAETVADVERGLDRALDEFYGFLDESHLPTEVVRFFREQYDFANLKGALKGRLLSAREEGLFTDLGTIPREAFAGHLDELPEPFGPIAERLLRVMSAGEAAPETAETVATIDAEVDRAMFGELARLARESRSPFLKELAALQVDIANVKSLLRARVAGVPADAALGLVIEGGSISAGEFEDLYVLSPIEAAERLAALPALRGIASAELADPARLDVLADNVVVAHLRRARVVSIGAEPVIAYVMGREAEVRAVRTLLIGRLAGLPTEVLRSRLRNLYV